MARSSAELPSDILIQRITERMEAHKYSVTSLARRAGISHSTLSLILSGQVTQPTAGVLLALANALNCDVEYLVGQSHHPRAPRTPKLFIVLRAETGAYRRSMSGVIERTIEGPLWERYSDRSQFAVEIDDDTMNRHDPPFPRGFYALAVDCRGLPIIDGAVYVIRSTKDGGETFETIIRRVREFGGWTELTAAGTEPDPPRRLDVVLDSDTSKDTFAIGLVYGIIHLSAMARK